MDSDKTSRIRNLALTACMAAALGLPGTSHANHPVLVEGQQDFDGDGRIGAAEDADGPDGDPAGLTFGTLAGCLGALNAAVNQNGICQIVTSGNFVETVVINGAGQVTIEAAPGVLAGIEAFVAPPDARRQEFPTAAADPLALQAAPGIVIDSPNDRYVILRNLTVTNWTTGIVIRGASHVLLDRVRVDHNINNGILVSDMAQVLIQDSQITSTGFRLNPGTGNFPTDNAPMPGKGVVFQGQSRGRIVNTTISGNFDDGLDERDGADVDTDDVTMFDNNRGGGNGNDRNGGNRNDDRRGGGRR